MTIFGFLFLGWALGATATLLVMDLEISKDFFTTWFKSTVAAVAMLTAFVCVWIAIWKGLV